MPETLPRHPAWMFRRVVLDRWNPENVAGLDPTQPPDTAAGLSFTRDWYTTVDYDPHVALTNFSEGVASASRYTSQTAGRPASFREGTGMATIFAEGDRRYGDPDGGEQLAAEDIVDALRAEIERCAGAAMGDDDLPRPWEHLATTWDSEGVDREPTPPVFQQQISIYYMWNKTT